MKDLLEIYAMLVVSVVVTAILGGIVVGAAYWSFLLFGKAWLSASVMAFLGCVLLPLAGYAGCWICKKIIWGNDR